ncbi:MAG: hypothetical protein EAZ73_14120 [Oscillatoriales cyanobacterium]|nr:MAG: hypothetical protein EAZ73_14120 [Oscillatoriales cyanobacterium]
MLHYIAVSYCNKPLEIKANSTSSKSKPTVQARNQSQQYRLTIKASSTGSQSKPAVQAHNQSQQYRQYRLTIKASSTSSQSAPLAPKTKKLAR